MKKAYARMMEAAKKLHGLNTQAEVGKLIGQYDQMLTNWKTRGIPNKEVLDIARAIGCNPYWLRDGTGNMELLNSHKVMEPAANYAPRDQILDDLSDLEPEDAAAWRARIFAAATKARKLRQEMKDRTLQSGQGDPPLGGRRTA